MTERGLAWHAGWHALSWFALAAHALVVSTLLFRITGPADYGVWATIAAFRAAILFVDAGLAFGVTRDAALLTAGDAKAEGRVRASMLLYGSVGVGFAVLAILLRDLPATMLDLPGPAREEASALALLIGLETALTLLSAPLTATLRGIQRFDILAGGSVVVAIAGIALLVILAPTLGLVGAGLAVLIARSVGTATYGFWFVRNLPAVLRPRFDRPSVSAVTRFAAPLWLAAVGSAIGMSTDVPIVGAFFGAAPAGSYGIGATAPYVGAALLFVLMDTAFPRLATAGRTSIEQLVRILLFGGALLAVAGFGGLILFRTEFLRVWLGVSPPLAEAAMTVYAFVWLVNVPVHVLAIAAIAKGHHRVLGPLVLLEALANILLSVLLAVVMGPIGPAIATLVTVSISNVAIVPLLLAQRSGIRLGRLLAPLAAGGLLGLAVAGTARGIALMANGDIVRVALGIGVGALTVGVVGLAVLTGRIELQRWFGVVFDGGWRVLADERAERVRMRRWLSAEGNVGNDEGEPLVTVRIATYNRGQLVADRAIASAIRQTYRNIEILVVGDNCDAATAQAVKDVADPRIRFVNLPERGRYPEDPTFRWMVAGAKPMNHGLEIARGEWIAPLDDDDEFTDDHVEVLLREALTRGLDFVYGAAEMEIEPSEWRRVGSWPLRHGEIVHASVLYSAKLRGFKHSYESWRLNEPGDWNLWRRMAAAGARMGFVDRVVCKHYLESRETRSPDED